MNSFSIKYISSIDSLKGLLIVLVIIGHIALGTLNENLLRYLIYTFHMPLFMAVSGYLLNLDKLKRYNIVELIKSYLFRIIIPWCIAVVVYYLYLNRNDISIQGLISSFLNPIYHFWFVPSFLLFVFSFWICLKINLSKKFLLIFGIITAIVYIFFHLNINTNVSSISKCNFSGR